MPIPMPYRSTMRTFVLLVAAAATSQVAQAQAPPTQGAQAAAPATATASTAPPARKAPCSTPEFRQFDFWIGEWEVTANGKLAGHSQITPLYRCGLREEYSTPSGYIGTSLNVFDQPRGVWHQTWVDNQGGALGLDGGLRDGKMVLEADRPPVDGKVTRERITWTPNPDGTVRQHWEQSTDGGKTWTTAFDGLYKKKAKS